MEGAFRDLHFGIMSTFVNVKIVRFAIIVKKDRNNIIQGAPGSLGGFFDKFQSLLNDIKITSRM